MPKNVFSDEKLVAYLDGEKQHAPIDDIAVALLNDAALVHRLDALRIDTTQIADSFQAIINSGKTAPLMRSAAANRNAVKRAVAASLVGIMVGFGAGQYAGQPAQQGWKDYVAAYQSLYTTSTLSSLVASGATQQQELDRVGASIGKELTVAALSGTPEASYKRAQILGYKGQPLVQLTFLSSTGVPIALCILRTSGTSEQTTQFSEMEGMRAAHWTANGYDYLLIGGQNDALLQRMANDLAAKQV